MTTTFSGDIAANHSSDNTRPEVVNVVKGYLVPLRTKAEVESRDETSA